VKSFLSNPLKRKQLVLALIDSIIVIFALLCSYAFRIVIYEGGYIFELSSRFSWLILLAALLHLGALYIFELYNLEEKRSDNKLLLLIITSVLTAAGMLAIFSYLDPQNKLGRVVLAVHLPVTIVFLYLWRKLFFRLSKYTVPPNNLLMIGNSPLDDEIQQYLNKMPFQHYKIVGKIYNYKENPGKIEINGILGGNGIYEMVKEKNVHTIVTSDNLAPSPLLRSELMNLKFAGISIYNAPVFYKKLTGKIPMYHVKDSWFLFHNSEGLFGGMYKKNLKRTVDIFVAAALLIMSAPFALICCLAVKLTSRGPVLFKQERLGANQRPFTLMKFRSMVFDAERECGPVWSSKCDHRVTKIGGVLRKTRLDEIPQLINVLKGDMSFVGPRPIRKHFADMLAKKIPYYRMRFLVKPGITGWAQVKHDYAGSEEGQAEKLEYDLFYIQNQTLLFDLYIFLKTIQTIIFRPGQ
jgi:exopolysaccharide biosynthesis polyprenyl glycosylphosphotransferase